VAGNRTANPAVRGSTPPADSIMNHWLKLLTARKIAEEIQFKYCGNPQFDAKGAPIEDDMIQYLWDHPDYTDDMWLEVHWDDFDNVCWVQVGTDQDLVPR